MKTISFFFIFPMIFSVGLYFYEQSQKKVVVEPSLFLIDTPKTKYSNPEIPKGGLVPDSLRPKYQYFYKATVGIVEWQRSADTMNYVLNLLGETLTVPQAREYKALFYRNFSKLQFSLDSVKIPNPKTSK